MSAIGLIVAIALPVALILFGLVMAGRRQQAQQAQRLQARAVKQGADDLLEALEFLILVDNFKEVQLAVLERVEQLYVVYQEALPKKDNNSSAQELFDAAPYRRKIDEGKGNRRVLKSDREIRFARRQFGRILKALNVMARKKLISEAAMMEYRRYLRLTLLEKEVDTYTAQGDVAAGRGDVITATNYYKAAKKILIEFDLQYPEKNQRIRDLTQRTASLYNGGEKKEGSLAQALSKEIKDEHDPFGIPTNPNASEKRKF
ncbi:MULTISPECIES: hypothetical protein [Oceanospirillaceae]|jgi:hypothetical protein|uniref:hypothetical protein n=1 Tax=Oceanospirillaceae TaxID=135620 RepID=UPI001190F9A9|nr:MULTISPECIES: hypothetical protein [Thalassolituus]MBU2037817.1 hypothetical protein [Gammaproteobacteria bacterium]MCB2385436.1 hypothetical protein [Thalassolituus alkanivorans]MCB2423309.1 hypothetical protein [Thalassolituus alkanivorans]TVV43325.1 hypothetical protein FOT50_12900 [Thalassolituus sp. C2-1]